MTLSAPTTKTGSTLKRLRALIPTRDCDHDETLSIAERQASRLVALLDSHEQGVSLEALAALPRLRIVYEALPVSGMSHWNGHEWIVTINEGDSPARQRFTVLHEFKHIIDHGKTERLYRDQPGTRGPDARAQAELAADYFAGCALVPRRALKAAWGNGLQQPERLADHFGVSLAAIQVRLDQTGLSRDHDPEPEQRRERCARPVRTPYWRPQRFQVVRAGYQPAYGRRRFV